ncbi:ribonuclease III [Exophiala viscosa]|uniref:Ribonuclease III n=1 Tax=Exophiala viscosa TaxID=2486360 RepID=A0AAN6DQ59_9EURO|nr:ribonuclease III [Exophiala viscosa]
MSHFDRKRKTNNHHNSPNKRVQRDDPRALESKPMQQPDKDINSSDQSIPPLPAISPRYEDVVFTHPSVNTQPGASYDRLEFLGDAYLELIASQLIYAKFPDLGAGRMSQIREDLVKNETLANYVVLYGLDKRLSQWERLQRESKHAWLKIKGDLLESYVAAIILSNPTDGMAIIKKWLGELWGPKLDAQSVQPQVSSKSKEDLAKKISGKGVKIKYVDERDPVVHYGKGKETYYIAAYLNGWGWENRYLGSGEGLSRIAAGQAAAAAALSNRSLIDEIVAKRAETLAQQRNETQRKEESQG